jgi:ParB family chromosome partitioning protein
LSALISTPTVPPPVVAPADDRLRDVPLSLISANPYQPRRDFDDASLGELEESLRANGLLQPISLRSRNGRFELIAGERRLRAAKKLGWQTIPAMVREISDREHLQLALVENLQRENLNPIDEAEGFRQLIDEFGFAQQQIAESVGKDRSTIANALRLLNLPATVRDFVRTGKLSAGHARALLSLPDEASVLQAAQQVVDGRMTVRAVERLAQSGRRPQRNSSLGDRDAAASAAARQITDRLRRYLQTDVQILADAKSRGELRIRFYSADDLERLLDLITGSLEDGGTMQ